MAHYNGKNSQLSAIKIDIAKYYAVDCRHPSGIDKPNATETAKQESNGMALWDTIEPYVINIIPVLILAALILTYLRRKRARG